MSVEQNDVIDAIGTEVSTGFTVLSISDHLNWSDEREHLKALQDKLNAYFEFIESGQLHDERPYMDRAKVRIEVFSLNPLPECVMWFIDAAVESALKNQIVLKFRNLPVGY